MISSAPSGGSDSAAQLSAGGVHPSSTQPHH